MIVLYQSKTSGELGCAQVDDSNGMVTHHTWLDGITADDAATCLADGGDLHVTDHPVEEPYPWTEDDGDARILHIQD